MDLKKNLEIIKQYYRTDLEQVSSIISDTVHSSNDVLNDVNNYILKGLGKKIRPLLAFLSADICSKDITINEKTKVIAAAAEIIHTSTLLHDDVVDESFMRRGHKTLYSEFPAHIPVLIGDFWLSKAINIIINQNCGNQTIKNFAQTLEDLADGEMYQQKKALSVDTSEEDYLYIINKKTASLFLAAVRSAAIVSEASQEKLSAVTEYAFNLGLSFQIRDDILDYETNPIDGKDVGSDLSERKITMPLLCAFKANPSEENLIRQDIKSISIKNGNDAKSSILIDKVTSFVLSNNGVIDAKIRLDEFIEKAVNSLSIFEDSEVKNLMILLVRSLTLS